MVSHAEHKLQKDFSKHFLKSTFKAELDFKEVFKWIVSPLLAKELGVPANLDGSFHVTCAFLRETCQDAEEESKELTEEQIMAQL